MSDRFGPLADELDKESFQWLSEANPDIADALEVAVIRGASPEEIRAFVLRRVGGERSAIANRCEGAARYLIGQKVREKA